MKPENKQFLDEHLFQFTTLERAFYVRGLSVHIRDGMLRVMREEFNPGYNGCSSCDNEIMSFVRQLYTNYCNWLRKEYNDNTIYKDITEAILEMNKLPLIVHTGFPANK